MQEYKESIALKKESQEKATISIIIYNTNKSRYSYRYKSSIIEFERKLKSKINKLKNPFLKIIDIENLDRSIVTKGKINLSLARLLEVKAILEFNIIDIRSSEGTTSKTSKKAYIKEAIKTINKLKEETITYKYKKTRYTEVYKKNTINLSANYKLISTGDKSIMLSDIIKLVNEDRLKYADYPDDKSKLIPGYWVDRYTKSKDDVIKDNKLDITELQTLLKSKKTIKSIKVLHTQIIDEGTDIISSQINKYNPRS